MVASIPTVRLNFHLSRLVQSGYKVGVIRSVNYFVCDLSLN